MAQGITPGDTFEYICREDRKLPKEEQTVFVCGYTDADQDADLDDKLGALTDDGYQVAMGSLTMLALHYGLKEVRNIDGKGNDLKLERDETAKKLKGGLKPWKTGPKEGLSLIKKAARNEVAEAIKKGGELTEEELKNL